MRILIVHNYYQHHGGEDSVFHLEAQTLGNANVVKTLTFKNKKGISGLLQFMAYPFNLHAAIKVRNTIAEFKPDVVHIHNLHYASGPLLIQAIKKCGIPIVMTLHNYRMVCPSATLFHKGALLTTSLEESFPWTAIRLKVLDHSFIKTFWVALTYWMHKSIGTFNKVDQYIVLSEFAKSIFSKSKVPIRSTQFTIKGNYVETPVVPYLPREESFIYIGRLSEEKGILPLLHAVKGTTHHLKIFGTGPQVDEVMDIVATSPNLTYYGFESKEIIYQHLSSADALIVPSICFEGMPITILEAFALGTPVICSRIGILNEMVIPLYTGLHFNPFEAESIKQGLQKWHNLTQFEKDSMRSNCKREYLKNYTPEINIKELLTIYQKQFKHMQP